MKTIWGREPVAIATAVQLVLLAAVSLGLDLTVEQVAAIVAAVAAVLAVLVRSTVTAPANLPTHASEENADV
jgi:uncharacterized membrane protein YvlD (DUF360 family)